MAKKKQEPETPEIPERLAQVRRRCRGHFNQNVGEVLKRMERKKHVRREHVGKVVEATVARLEELGEPTNTGTVVRALVEVDRQSARDLHRMAYGGCGADLNPAIAELPEDGVSHDFECPRCGAPHHATRVPAEDA